VSLVSVAVIVATGRARAMRSVVFLMGARFVGSRIAMRRQSRFGFFGGPATSRHDGSSVVES
jgi:hypothetical protein